MLPYHPPMLDPWGWCCSPPTENAPCPHVEGVYGKKEGGRDKGGRVGRDKARGGSGNHGEMKGAKRGWVGRITEGSQGQWGERKLWGWHANVHI